MDRVSNNLPVTACIEPNLADDLLRGAEAISDFIGESLRKTYYGLERGYIPAGKQGETWIGSKARLREHYSRLTAGPPQAVAA